MVPTIKDMLENAKNPENLVICIAWQHSLDDKWDNLDEFKDDPRFKILDIDYKDSKGVCWARNLIQHQYDGEDYTLQLDSHHRFTKYWDMTLIRMLNKLKEKGHEKPLLTAYIPSFNPEKDPQERIREPWRMNFDRFIPEGAIFFLPGSIDDWRNLNEPVPARFYSAHFCFAPGSFCLDVPHDPNYYFHGEEINIAVRAYTHGYDLFHPHRVVIWHEYTRKGRAKQWDDDIAWGQRNNESHKRNRKFFEIDGEVRDIDFEIYDLGTERTLEDYERYSGIQFKTRGVQQYTLDLNNPPNPFIEDKEEYEKSFLRIFRHCIDIYHDQLHYNDYDFWVISFEMNDGEVIYRQDADEDEIKMMIADKEYIKIWRQFETSTPPEKWVVWMHSKNEGWVDRYEGNLTS